MKDNITSIWREINYTRIFVLGHYLFIYYWFYQSQLLSWLFINSLFIIDKIIDPSWCLAFLIDGTNGFAENLLQLHLDKPESPENYCLILYLIRAVSAASHLDVISSYLHANENIRQFIKDDHACLSFTVLKDFDHFFLEESRMTLKPKQLMVKPIYSSLWTPRSLAEHSRTEVTCFSLN